MNHLRDGLKGKSCNLRIQVSLGSLYFTLRVEREGNSSMEESSECLCPGFETGCNVSGPFENYKNYRTNERYD